MMILEEKIKIEEDMIVIRDSKNVVLILIEFIIKSGESSAENKMKNAIEKLLLKYKHGNIIHEHRTHQNEWTS